MENYTLSKNRKLKNKGRRKQKRGALGRHAVDRSFTLDVLGCALSPEKMPLKGGIGLPIMMRRQHRYCESRVVNGTTGALGTYVFSANGLFDPNITGTGHQPYGFDQMIAYYQKAVVERSKIVVEVITSQIGQVGVILSTESNVAATLTSADTLTEPGRGQAAICYSTSGPARTLEASWDKAALYPEADPADFTTVSNSNPTNQDYYTFYVQALDGSTTVAANIIVVITYDVTWQDPVTIASS